MTEEELELLRKKVDEDFNNYYKHIFDKPRRFLAIKNPDGSKKYVSPVAQARGARDLFVPSTEHEFNEFVERTGGMLATDGDELSPGDCVCDVTLDPNFREVRTYLKYDPNHFGAVEEYIAPNQIYSSIEEYKNDYFGQETDN